MIGLRLWGWLAAIWTIGAATLLAAEGPIPKDARLREEGNVAFTEGPAWHPTGNVYFSDIANDRIMRRDRKGEESRKLLFDWGTDRGPDGMALDQEGRLYVAAGFNFPKPPVETNTRHKAGVYVLSAEGKLLQFIPVPADMVTNCAFGDGDLKTLYITAGHKLWSIRTQTPGRLAWPAAK